MTRARVLLLSPIVRDVRPDIDLASTTGELLSAIATCAEVVHEPVATLGDIERAVARHRPEIVFNACETIEDRSDGEPLVPQLLERHGVEYTGSTATCLRRCLGKTQASTTLANGDVPVPETFAPGVRPSVYPVILKPDAEDGSVGIHAGAVVHDEESFLRAASATPMPLVAQRYVSGREIALSLLGWPEPRVLSPGEIAYDDVVFAGRERILTYASKWDPSSPDYRGTRSVEALLTPALFKQLSRIALRAARILDMRDYGRVDFRVDAAGCPYVIDVNPNCDLSSDGGFMRAATRSGLACSDVIATILSGAIERRARRRR